MERHATVADNTQRGKQATHREDVQDELELGRAVVRCHLLERGVGASAVGAQQVQEAALRGVAHENHGERQCHRHYSRTAAKTGAIPRTHPSSMTGAESSPILKPAATTGARSQALLLMRKRFTTTVAVKMVGLTVTQLTVISVGQRHGLSGHVSRCQDSSSCIQNRKRSGLWLAHGKIKPA